MNIFNKRAQLLAISTFLVASPLGAAFAQPVDEAIARLKEFTQEQGFLIEWENVEVSGNDAVLKNVIVSFQNANDNLSDEPLPIGDVQLNDISEAEDGYLIEEIKFSRFDFADDKGTAVNISDLEMSGVLLANEDKRDIYGGYWFYDSAELENIDVTVEGTRLLSMTGISSTNTSPAGGKPMDFTGAIEEFNVDLSIAKDTEQYPVIEALGYEKISGYAEFAGSWNAPDGRLAITQNDISIVDAGTLGITMELGGYTTDFIKSLRDVQKQISDNPDGDSAAQGFAILGLMQQLTLHGAEINFEDDSLTNRVLDYTAKSQGTNRDTLANQVKAIVPFMLAQLNNPELATAASQAVNTFIDNPKSLRIAAAPASPVPFALIMAHAMSNPQELTKTLAVEVTAND